MLKTLTYKTFTRPPRPHSRSKLHKMLRNCFFENIYVTLPEEFQMKKITSLPHFHTNHPISWKMGFSGWFHFNCKHFNQKLLPAITNFLNLSHNTLMIVSIDIPLHVSIPGSRERSTLHQFSQDSLVHWSINYEDKGILVKDCRDRGVVVVVVWINLIGWMFEKGEKIVGMVV